MKKVISILLIVLLVFTFTSCSSTKETVIDISSDKTSENQYSNSKNNTDGLASATTGSHN